MHKKKSPIYAPAPPQPVPAPVPSSAPSILRTVGENIMQGTTFGAGSAIGHRVVASVFDNSSTEKMSASCTELFTALQECMKSDDTDICKGIFRAYTDCMHKDKT